MNLHSESNKAATVHGLDVPSSETSAWAQVVALDGERVWLEPLQTGSCGSCASAALCGSKGIGSLASRLEQRRFVVQGVSGLSLGDSVEIAFGSQNLVKAAAVAYVVPLFSALMCAALVQAQFGRDGLTVLGALAGMALGFGLMKLIARRLEAQGALSARIIHRHQHPIHFSHPGAQCDA